MVLVMKIRCMERRLRSNFVNEGRVVHVLVVAGCAQIQMLDKWQPVECEYILSEQMNKHWEENLRLHNM
jgi:hypothetical protein